jgi:hypothetical protein
MNNKFKIIETLDYILAVSDEETTEDLKRVERDWYYNIISNKVTSLNNITPNDKKIIAYQPKGNVPALDLPLLPEIVVEDDVEKLALQDFKDNDNGFVSYKDRTEGFISGYETATKVYSEEDLRNGMLKMFDECLRHRTTDINYERFIKNYIQSLKQAKTSVWFVAEMEGCDNCINHQGQHLSPDCCHNYKLKTTTINGKEYLVGTYLYE